MKQANVFKDLRHLHGTGKSPDNFKINTIQKQINSNLFIFNKYIILFFMIFNITMQNIAKLLFLENLEN